MTLKKKFEKGFVKTVSFVKTHGTQVLTGAALTAFGALLITVNRQQSEIKELQNYADMTIDLIEYNEKVARYEASHPWFFDANDPTKPRRVEISEDVVQANWPQDM